jgi:hypothetical protein
LVHFMALLCFFKLFGIFSPRFGIRFGILEARKIWQPCSRQLCESGRSQCYKTRGVRFCPCVTFRSKLFDLQSFLHKQLG